MTGAISGEQWTLRQGADEVVVVEVGGGLRTWTRGGVPVLAGYSADEMCLSGRGQVLFPWPNRIRDGQFRWAGTDHQLPLTEPKLHNASHGLVRFASWSLRGRSDGSLTVGHVLHAQPGWPWPLDIEVTYAVCDPGLRVTTVVTNLGSHPAPFGLGFHPYVAIAATDPGAVRLTIPGTRFLAVDERMLPTGLVDVVGTDRDFRAERALGRTALDTAYTGLDRTPDGRWAVALAGLDDLGTVTVWGDDGFGWVQVFTGKAAAEGEHGIAVEPSTCPPDALRSDTDVLLLRPGERWTGTWGVDLTADRADDTR